MAGCKQWREEEEEYSELKDLSVSLDRDGVGKGEAGSGRLFSLCFWLYLSSSARPSSVILKQMTSKNEDGVPFLVLSEENKLMLLPLVLVHKVTPSANKLFPWTDMPHAAAEMDCPLEKWVHVGCEVAMEYINLHVDGKLAGEGSLSFSSSEHYLVDLKRLTLVGSDGNLGGYVYHLKVLPPTESMTDQFFKNPPVRLSIDSSCTCDGVEEEGDGAWSIVGGKASCRRNFSLEVVLLDAFGRSIHKEMEVVASLLYADNGASVERTKDDAEAPLFTSCDGLEYPSTDKPVTLLRGRATFKLKISQLSSKCDNRLFRVCFHKLHGQRYPFLEAYSQPIRCISRSRSNRTTRFGKRLISSAKHLDETHRLKVLKSYLPSKHPKVEQDRSSLEIVTDRIPEKAFKKSLKARPTNFQGTASALSDSDSDATDSDSDATDSDCQEAIVSDAMIFRYCLEGTYERSILLKELTVSASDEDLVNFAEQVCLYSGCSHHRNQILISKQLLQEGTDIWNFISHNKERVFWMDAAPEINKKFMEIAKSANRALSGQDLEVLQRIARCDSDLCQEAFERMWHWLFPVAFAISMNQINKLWQCMSIKWIEGLITREEAENALKGPEGLEKAGTFVLRFPTSRSWPHPDAGSLLVTYVGTDSLIHNKLLSLDHRGSDSVLLQDLLLEEPELSQLGRVSREGHSSS